MMYRKFFLAPHFLGGFDLPLSHYETARARVEGNPMSIPSDKAKEIFLNASAMNARAERQAYLDAACAGDAALRSEVEDLLGHHEQLGSFLQSAADSPVPTIDEPMRERPGTVIGPYKLMEQIGEGGMGLVFVAEQQQPVRRKVALKVIKPGMDTRQVVARFEAERQALALMDHPNISKVLDGGETASGRPYFVMELVKGVPITEYCDQNQVSVRERLELFLHVCQAVQHAHQKGIIHRDIKPSNVLIMSQDGTPLVKVIDFGVAKAIGQQLTDKTIYTQFTQLVGTPLYMSPEQAGQSGMDVDTRTDIYALGVLLYELLTGTTPFDRERLKDASYDEIRRIIREEEPARPSTRISTLGQAATTLSMQRKSDPKRLSHLFRGELDWIVMKALEKDRNRRYETANTFLADVQRYLHDEPVLACPPSAGYRLRKLVRRNRTALAVAGLVIIFIAVLAGVAGWVIRERLDREAALDGEVDRTLEEAERLREQGKWPEALAVVERGDKLLASARRVDRPARLLELHKELNLAQRLEDIYQGAQREQTRLPAAGRVAGRGDAEPAHSAEEEFFWGREQDARFAAEFRDFGIDIDALVPAEAAARIGGTGIRLALVQALDEWAVLRKRARGDNDPGWKKLVEVARWADGDDWRNRFREALVRGDRQALEKLADSLPIREVPPATVYRLGHALRDLGSVDRAVAILREGQRRHPEDFWLNDELGYLSRNFLRPPRYDDALRYYSVALAVRPQNVRAHLSVADTLEQMNAGNEAVAEYSRALELAPGNVHAWRCRGWAHSRFHQYKEAVADFTKAINLDPKNAWALCGRANAYKHLDQYEEAIADFTKAIGLAPEKEWPWRGRGVAYTDLQQYDKAIADFSKTIDLDPKNAEARYYRGWAYNQLHQHEQAIADLSKVIDLDPKNAGAWCYRGWAYHQLHQYDRALANYAKAADLDPKGASYWDMQAWLLATCADARLRDVAKAVRLAKKAVDISPKVGNYWSTLGAAHYRAGNWKDAVAALEKSMPLKKGGDSFDWLFLAMACCQLGEKEKAQSWFDRAVQWMDKHQPADEELRRLRTEAADLLGIKHR
jgi:tetratricopeptide (TPR) repeat protein